MIPTPVIPMLNGPTSAKVLMVVGLLIALAISAKRKPEKSA